MRTIDLTETQLVEAAILDAFDENYEPSPDEIARYLVDLGCAAGEYEGCSTELEQAYTEYEAIARRLLNPKEAA